MEWRCEFCGKPHESNDPPCDDCGHGSFERAVVPAAPGGDSTMLWVCTECGREHPRHNPPCSRCGNPTLERRERTVDEDELVAPGYLDLLTPRYALGIALALGLGVVLVLGLAGVVRLPGMEGGGVPDVTGVPGSPDSVDGLSAAAVEAGYVERFNELRAEAGEPTLDRSDRLDAIATFYNQRRVKRDLADGDLPSGERMRSLFDGTCGGDIGLAPLRLPTADSADSARALGESLADRQRAQGGGEAPADRGITGVDVHGAPDGTVYVTQFTC